MNWIVLQDDILSKLQFLRNTQSKYVQKRNLVLQFQTVFFVFIYDISQEKKILLWNLEECYTLEELGFMVPK